MANINFIVKNDIELKGNLIFEGATANAYETTLAITDPTADRTITFPNATGTVALTSDLSSYAALSGPTFTGTVGIATLDLTTATTATAATSYFVETGSDGVVRPKTLANVKTEVVTTAAVNSAAATTVGTIGTGTWQADIISATYGGTGQSTWTKGDLLYSSATNTLAKLAIPATNGFVLTYNSTSGLPEWAAAAGGTSYIGTTATQASSATQALTGISSITGATTLALDSTTTSALNIGTGANAKAITVGNNTTTTAVNVNTGNILNSATLGGGLDINDTINIHNATTTIASTAATSIFTDTAAYSTIEYTIQAKVGSNYRSSKIMLVCNGTTTTSFTEYAILENSANSIPVTFTTTAASGIVTLNGAFTGWTTGNNITVKVIRTGIV